MRGRIAWSFPLLALAFAGCLGPAAPLDPETPGLTAALAPTFHAPAIVGGGGGIETSFEAGPDGRMLVCEMGMGTTNPVYASEDGGATWRALEPLPANDRFSNGDCDVAVGDDGSWYVMYALATRALPLPSLPLPPPPVPVRPGVVGVGLTLATSRDHGATWDVAPLQPPRTGLLPPGVGHRPWLRAQGDDLFLTYYGVPLSPGNPGTGTSATLMPGSAWFQRSLDRGATWEDPMVLAENPVFMGGGEFDFADDGETLRVPLVRVDDGAETLSYAMAVSRDRGATWEERPVLANAEARFGVGSVAHDAEGVLYFPVAFLAEERVEVAVLLSRDDGATWSEPIAVARGVDFGERSMATVLLDQGPEGVAVAWQHLVPAGDTKGYTVGAAGLDAAAASVVRWTADLAPPAGEEAHLEFFALDHDAAGRVHVVYPVPGGDCAEGGACVVHLAEA